MALNYGLMLAMLALLVGCTDDKLKAEYDLLRQQLDECQAAMAQKQAAAFGERQALLEYGERQAAIAAGCDWLVPICPASVTDAGHQAQSKGYGGGGSGWYWAIALGKLLALGAILGSAAAAAAWGWVRHAAPARDAVAAARRDIETAEARAAAAQRAALQAEIEERQARVRLAAVGHDLAEMQGRIQATQEALQQAQTELEGVQTAKAAIDLF